MSCVEIKDVDCMPRYAVQELNKRMEGTGALIAEEIAAVEREMKDARVKVSHTGRRFQAESTLRDIEIGQICRISMSM